MRTPSSSELLSLWESAFDRRPAERALSLLALAMPELGYEELALCSIGRRDDLLLAMRERLFGDELASVANCPACQARVETSWSATALRASLQDGLQDGLPEGAHSKTLNAAATSLSTHTGTGTGTILEVLTHGHRIEYRLPTTRDMLAIEAVDDPAAAQRMLLARCVLDVTCGALPVALSCLPAAALETLEAAMALADPMADIECALACPDCGHGWNVNFDIGRYLWSELHTWAQRLLVDVHTLARAYGWREADILAMSPGRRSLYVEMSLEMSPS